MSEGREKALLLALKAVLNAAREQGSFWMICQRRQLMSFCNIELMTPSMCQWRSTKLRWRLTRSL